MIPEMFRDIHEILQFEHFPFSSSHHPNPIKTILQFKDGYYFLPTFYVLCKHYRVNSDVLADQLFAFLDSEFHPLLDTIRTIDPKIIETVSRDLTPNTLHFCANKILQEENEDYKISNEDNSLKCIVENNKRAILRVTSNDQMVQLIRSLQERYFPIQRFKNFKNPCIWRYYHSWEEIKSSTEISQPINDLWQHIKRFLLEEKNLDFHSSFLIDEFNVKTVVADAVTTTTTITSDTELSKDMNTHKWFLRLEWDCVLDLLTGHVSGVVPEFYMSWHRINIEIPRKQMIGLCCNQNSYHPLRRLYETLTSREFFSSYVQELHSIQTDNFYVPLRYLAKGRYEFEITELSKSMLHFYMNMCKWTCFDYDFLILLLNILSSVFVGGTRSNQQNIFIVRGSMCNGKTTLFRLMNRFFGGYYQSIRYRSWGWDKLASSPPPEFVSSCRMITSHERVDTEEHFEAFRKVYTQNPNAFKIFYQTNFRVLESKATEAFGDRVFVIPFNAKFMGFTPSTTLEQMSKHSYMIDADVVDNSYKGCFFMLYYHLKKNMNPDDVLLYYREESKRNQEE